MVQSPVTVPVVSESLNQSTNLIELFVYGILALGIILLIVVVLRLYSRYRYILDNTQPKRSHLVTFAIFIPSLFLMWMYLVAMGPHSEPVWLTFSEVESLTEEQQRELLDIRSQLNQLIEDEYKISGEKEVALLENRKKQDALGNRERELLKIVK